MKYLGIARTKKSQVIMPDSFRPKSEESDYEAIQIGDDILLMPSPVDKKRIEQILKLAEYSVKEHEKTLRELAK